MKLELMWIISIIVASIDMESNMLVYESLFYDNPSALI